MFIIADANGNTEGLPSKACGAMEKARIMNGAWLKRFHAATPAAFAAIVNVAMLGISGTSATGLLGPDFQQDERQSSHARRMFRRACRQAFRRES
jgi:hypothetical protein